MPSAAAQATNSTRETLQVGLVRTMPHFSMDVYADGLLSGFRTQRPDWQIVELLPRSIDRRSRSVSVRAKKAYERFWRFPRHVQHQSADIFHIVDHSDAHNVQWLKKKKKPVVVTCHDLINYFYPQNLQGSVRLPVVSDNLWRSAVEAMQQADAIVAVSSNTAADITRLLKIESDRIFVVPNAVDSVFSPAPDAVSAAIRADLNIPSDALFCLNVGSNHPRKNVSAILQALSILKQKNIPVQFLKVNGVFSNEQNAFIADHNLSDSIQQLEDIAASTLVYLYSSADILVAPSFHEGFGLTLLEAMACGTPVMTSNVSAMPEVIGDAGLLIDPDDSQSIADSLQRFYEDVSQQEQLRTKGLARAKLFSWEKTAEEIAKIYHQILEKY